MIEPKHLGIKDLKGMHKSSREKYECAKDNTTKAKASIVLGMLDEEFERRGYDVCKLFKGYNPKARYSKSENN